MQSRKLATLFLVVLLLGLWQQTPVQAQGYGGHRSTIGRTLGDLRAASRYAHGGRERERIDNAQRHLREFDRELSRGRYNNHRIDEAIEDVHNVVRNNNLPPRERDILGADLQELRGLRSREQRRR